MSPSSKKSPMTLANKEFIQRMTKGAYELQAIIGVLNLNKQKNEHSNRLIDIEREMKRS